MYLSGIFGDCSKDAVIDHAVTLIAYGKARGAPYAVLSSGQQADKFMFFDGYLMFLFDG